MLELEFAEPLSFVKANVVSTEETESALLAHDVDLDKIAHSTPKPFETPHLHLWMLEYACTLATSHV